MVLCLLAFFIPGFRRGSHALAGTYPEPECELVSFQNPDDEWDVYVESVFEEITYDGHLAYRMGREPAEHVLAHSSRGVFTLYAQVDAGGLYDFDDEVVLEDHRGGGSHSVFSRR